MDAWLGKASEHIVAYETDTYRAQRPVAYTNWPTLDPLTHPTESTVAEEVGHPPSRWASGCARGRWSTTTTPPGWTPTWSRATDAFPAGYFASYHAYPYYPDFMVLDPGYNQARVVRGAVATTSAT